MEETLYYNSLYDCYQSLLTEKQKSYFEGYYFYNLSFGELALNEGISRNAIYKQVKEVCEKLEEYERKLHLYAIKKELLSLKDTTNSSKEKERITHILDQYDL